MKSTVNTDQQSNRVPPSLLQFKLNLRTIFTHCDPDFRTSEVEMLVNHFSGALMKHVKTRLELYAENATHQAFQIFILCSYNFLQQYIQLGLLIAHETKGHDFELQLYSSPRLKSTFLQNYTGAVRDFIVSSDERIRTTFAKNFLNQSRSCSKGHHATSKPIFSNEFTRLVYSLYLYSIPELLACVRKEVEQELNEIEAMNEIVVDHGSLSQKTQNLRPFFARMVQSYIPIAVLFATQAPLLIEWAYRGLLFYLLSFFRRSTIGPQSGTRYLRENTTDIYALIEKFHFGWHIIIYLQRNNHTTDSLILRGEAENTFSDSIDRPTGSMKKTFSSMAQIRRFVKLNVFYPSRKASDLVRYLVSFSDALENPKTTKIIRFLTGITFLMQSVHVPGEQPSRFSSNRDLLLATSMNNDAFLAIRDTLSLFLKKHPEKDARMEDLQSLLVNMQDEISCYIYRRHDGPKEILQRTVFELPKDSTEKFWKLGLRTLFPDLSSLLQIELCLEAIHNTLAEMLVLKFFDCTKKNCFLDDCYRYRNELLLRFKSLSSTVIERKRIMYSNEKRISYPEDKAGYKGSLHQERGTSSLHAKQKDLDLALQQDEQVRNLNCIIRKCIVMINDFTNALESRILIENNDNTTHFSFPISHYYWPAKFSYVYFESGSLQSVSLLDSATWARHGYSSPQIDSHPNTELVIPVEMASFNIRLKISSEKIIPLKVSGLQLLALQNIQKSSERHHYHHKMAQSLQVSPECLYNNLKPLLTNRILQCKTRRGLPEKYTDDLCYHIG